MFSKGTWSIAILAVVIALVVFCTKRPEKDSKPLAPATSPQSAIAANPNKEGMIKKTHIPESAPDIISESPYKSQTPDRIREAQEQQKLWANNYQIADTWVVQIPNEANLDKVAQALGGQWVEEVAGLKGMHVIRVPGSQFETGALQTQATLKEMEEVTCFEQEVIEAFALRYDESPPPFSDPLLRDQWHLKNKGDRWNKAGEDANLYPAWNYGVSGAGVYIAVVDTGIQGSHPDLAENYRNDLDFDYIDNDSSAEPEANDETHGTAVAGVAAAATNAYCGVGAAYNAEIVGVRMIDEDRGIPTSRQASAVSHQSDIIHIYTNSWGLDTENGARMAGPGNLAFSAIKNAVENGRNGLGSIYVWAAGNGRAIGSNVNYDGWASHRYSIAVGAVGDHGKRSSYSEPGAPLLVCAHSNGDTSGIRTTDLLGQSGADPGDCRIDFGGTSSASPLVAGIVALMLEANPKLTWRDVKHILAKTAVKVATVDNDWSRNGAGYWVNHNYGFGRVDAAAAVRVAQTWTMIEDEQVLSFGGLNLNQAIPDNSTAGIQTFHTVEENISIEHVSVKLEIDAAEGDTMDWGDLEIRLTSPAGTLSILALPHTDAQKTYSEWTYWSVRHLDEMSAGVWTLEIKDRRTSNQHVAESWELEIYGTPPGKNTPPVAETDTIEVSSNTSFLDVLANDTDEDGDPLEIISIYPSPNSTTKILPSGLIEYTFGESLGGVDRFAYTMHDGRGGIRTAEVNISIPIPEATDDYVGTAMNTPIVVDVLKNDFDPQGDNIRIKTFGIAQNGTVRADGQLSLSYTPNEGYQGVDRFSYTITDDLGGDSSAEVVITVTANEDYALTFDGDDDRLEIVGSEGNHLNHPITVEAWIRPIGWGEGETGYGRILDKESFVFYLHGTGFPQYNKYSLLLSLDHANKSRSIHNTPANSIELNTWQHVAVTYDSISDVKLYIDGILQQLTVPFDQAMGLLSTNNQSLIVGEAFSNLRAFEGALDELRIWNKVLTGNEIRTNRFSTLSGSESGLMIYYDFNDGEGTIATNKAGSDENGSIREAQWIKGIIGENAPPISSSDEVHSVVGEKLIIPVTGNDTDPDGDPLRVSRILAISSGIASLVDGSIIFQPPEGFTGLVRIDYEVEDFYNGKTNSSLIITIGEGVYYSAWEAKNFAGALGDAENDSDFDSFSNFSEYAFGTDPLSGLTDPSLWNLHFDRETGITTFTYTILLNSLDVNYKLLHTTNLVDWIISQEGVDYTLVSANYISTNTETRIIQFQPEDRERVFLKLEALSLAGSD